MKTSKEYRSFRSWLRKMRLLRKCRYRTARQRLLAMDQAQRRDPHNLYRVSKHRAPWFPEEYAAMISELSPQERQDWKLTDAPIPGMPLKTT